MNLGEIKLDEQKVRDVAMEAAFQVAKLEVEDTFQSSCATSGRSASARTRPRRCA